MDETWSNAALRSHLRTETSIEGLSTRQIYIKYTERCDIRRNFFLFFPSPSPNEEIEVTGGLIVRSFKIEYGKMASNQQFKSSIISTTNNTLGRSH